MKSEKVHGIIGKHIILTSSSWRPSLFFVLLFCSGDGNPLVDTLVQKVI